MPNSSAFDLALDINRPPLSIKLIVRRVSKIKMRNATGYSLVGRLALRRKKGKDLSNN